MNKKIYLLLPFCLTLLPACSSSYTLTLINSDPEAGTIITEGGEFKKGEVIKIQVETFQGYKVDKWTDSVSGKIGSRAEFNFTMPSRDAELTVTYKYDDFDLNFDYKIIADENHYDFSNISDFGGFWPCYWTLNGEQHYNSDAVEITWKDTVEITDAKTSWSSEAFSEIKSITDENGDVLGIDSCSFEMPNHDKTLTFALESKCNGSLITTNIPNLKYDLVFSSMWWWRYNMIDSYYKYQTFTPDRETTVGITFVSTVTGNYMFDYWLDLDTNEILTTDRHLELKNYSGNHNLQIVLHGEE